MKDLIVTNLYVLIKNKYLIIINILLFLLALYCLFINENNGDLSTFYTYIITHMVFSFGIYMHYIISNKIINIEIMNYNRTLVYFIIIFEMTIYESIIISVFHVIISLYEENVIYSFFTALIVYFPLVLICIVIALIFNNFIVSSIISWFFLSSTGYIYLVLSNNNVVRVLSTTYHLAKLSIGRTDFRDLIVYEIVMLVLGAILMILLKTTIRFREYK